MVAETSNLALATAFEPEPLAAPIPAAYRVLRPDQERDLPQACNSRHPRREERRPHIDPDGQLACIHCRPACRDLPASEGLNRNRPERGNTRSG